MGGYPKYVVTINRPYYPSVQYFNNYDEAIEEFHALRNDEHEEDGEYQVFITMAEVIVMSEIKTYW